MEIAQLKARMGEVFRLFKLGRWDDLTLWQRAVVAPIELVAMAFREIRRDRGTQLAGSLAFVSALTVVPLLSVATSLMAAFGVFESQDSRLFDSLALVVPDAAGDVARHLQDFATNSAQAVGGIGAVALLVISLLLLNEIEAAFNNIWRGRGDRALVPKFLTFYALITLGPVLFSLSIIHSASIQIYLSRFGLDAGLVSQGLPLVYALALFTLMNKLLPNARVEWRAALFGGAFTAIAFELAKWGFNQYINLVILDAYNKLYGTLGLIPIFLIWLYITWFVVLLGAEMSYCFQHLRRVLIANAHDDAVELGRELRYVHDPMIVLDIVAPIARAFDTGAKPVGEEALIDHTFLRREVVREVLDRLIVADLLIDVDDGRPGRHLVPARPLDKVTLSELVGVFLRPPGRRPLAGARQVRERFADTVEAVLGGQTLAALAASEPDVEPTTGADAPDEAAVAHEGAMA